VSVIWKQRFLYGQDPAVVALSCTIYDLFYLGYLDQALTSAQKALALAREIDHPSLKATTGGQNDIYCRTGTTARKS
jgi:hypothetical protein